MNTEPAEQSIKPVVVADEKARLECDKIRAEIEIIRRRFYETPAFYVSISPVILGILGLAFTWASGWFDVQRTRINNEKLLVQIETEKLRKQEKDQQTHIGSLEIDLQNLKADRAHLTNQIALLEKERNEMRSAKDYFEREAKRLAGSETNALKLFTDLQTAQTERGVLSAELEMAKSTNASLSAIVANQKNLLLRIDRIIVDATNLELADKVSQKQYEAFVRKVFELGPSHWRVDPDPKP